MSGGSTGAGGGAGWGWASANGAAMVATTKQAAVASVSRPNINASLSVRAIGHTQSGAVHGTCGFARPNY